MSRKIHSEKDSERATRDGTAARTRPLSIQDIMLQREKKAASEAKKTKEAPQENDKGPSDYMEHGRGSKSRKEPKDLPVEGSKREKDRDTRKEASKKGNSRHEPREDPKKDDMRYTPKEVSKKDNFKDRPKDGSKTSHMKGISKVSEKEDLRDAPKKVPKKERSSIRDDDHIVVRDKGISTSHRLTTNISDLANERKGGELGDTRAKNGDATKSRKGPGKSRNDEAVAENISKDRSEKLRNETKRKYRNFDDEKNSDVDRPVLKRHDSARIQDSKHADKNHGRKDYAKSYHGEAKLKRRRSRSRDLDRERHGRSISPPPREQRRSYHGHDFGNPMEKARRKHIEGDKQRTSGTGGSYRRFESRLGGYSPRRKKTAPQAEQATTKTPSPVTQSLEKKSATWDQPPVKANQSNFLTTLHPAIGQIAPIPANFSAFSKDPVTKIETILAANNLSADSVQLTQATRPLRRLHIENLPDSATEDILIDCLNDFLLSSRLKHAQQSKPCLSCTINKEKRQAFVEFLTPEDATTALSFDGRSLNGYALKIRRPKEYIEMTITFPMQHGAQTESAEEVTLVSDTVADSPHKLMEIVSAFGPLAAYRFLFNKELGGPCAFVEYMDPAITPKACAGLSGMKLGGRVLTAVRAFTHSAEVDNEATPFYGIPDNAKSLLEEPTKVLQLQDVLYDMANICRFGAVKSVNIVEHLSGNANTAEEYRCSLWFRPCREKDENSIPEGLGQKDLPSNAALYESQAPADLYGTDERAALLTLQQVEADHKGS
ncbi:hypothetical protein PR202_ga27130 [Eleusine coracana subsp. coracana]|uniref:RRM domain-containing protein n=1 Tax=Eleusine coracana subsp. coracana TaxID=191504 RepID=A0AAV5DG09_ELECO|nr:hypothetical protein PR202_ga27130 [Eleusine coracana subsp. coracana]